MLTRDLYETELRGALALAAILTQEGLADAYFGGNAERVKQAVLARMKGRESDWEAFLKACNEDDPDDGWEKGLALLKS